MISNLSKNSLIKHFRPGKKRHILLVALLTLGSLSFYMVSFLTIDSEVLTFNEKLINITELQRNNTNCYSNFVFNKFNYEKLLLDISDDDVLKQSRSDNIFFHITNCIYDGVITINPRLINVFYCGNYSSFN